MKLSAKLLVVAAVSALGLLSAAPTFATPAIDALGQCFARSDTPEDDIVLVRYVFVMMAAHPKVADLSAASPEKVDEVNRQMGDLFERLMTKDCATETAAAFSEDGDGTYDKAFEALGAKAFGSVEADPAVQQAATQFIKYVDMNKIMQTLLAAKSQKK